MLRSPSSTLGMSDHYFRFGVDGVAGAGYDYGELPLFEEGGNSYYQGQWGHVMDPLMIPEHANPTFQPVAEFIDPRTVTDEELSPSSSLVTDSQSSGTRSPCASAAPFLEGQLATDSTLYTRQLNCYPMISPHQVTFAPTVTLHGSITPIAIDSTDLLPEPSPEEKPIPPQKVSTSVRRRGPGRPTKAQAATNYPNSKRPTGHSAVRLRRQMHNDSAMRSRARLNKALEDLWTVIPAPERTIQATAGEDNREVCRAVKVEVAIGYLKKLQAQVSKG